MGNRDLIQEPEIPGIFSDHRRNEKVPNNCPSSCSGGIKG
jgi:hypothetical protein